jgi:hypothetical protein
LSEGTCGYPDGYRERSSIARSGTSQPTNVS